jgi:hypothetical protein
MKGALNSIQSIKNIRAPIVRVDREEVDPHIVCVKHHISPNEKKVPQYY